MWKIVSYGVWRCVLINIRPFFMNIHGKHWTIDRTENKIKFSLLKVCSFFRCIVDSVKCAYQLFATSATNYEAKSISKMEKWIFVAGSQSFFFQSFTVDHFCRLRNELLMIAGRKGCFEITAGTFAVRRRLAKKEPFVWFF